MEIKHNRNDGSVAFTFSWKEIFTLFRKRKLKFNSYVFASLSTVILTIILENNKLKKDKK
jgi:hypothetical protein